MQAVPPRVRGEAISAKYRAIAGADRDLARGFGEAAVIPTQQQRHSLASLEQMARCSNWLDQSDFENGKQHGLDSRAKWRRSPRRRRHLGPIRR